MNSSSHRLTMWTAVDATAANDSDLDPGEIAADAERSSTLLARSSPQTVAAESSTQAATPEPRASIQIDHGAATQARGGETDPSHQTTRPGAPSSAPLPRPASRHPRAASPLPPPQPRPSWRSPLSPTGPGIRPARRSSDRPGGSPFGLLPASCAWWWNSWREPRDQPLTMAAIDPSGWRTSTRRSGCSERRSPPALTTFANPASTARSQLHPWPLRRGRAAPCPSRQNRHPESKNRWAPGPALSRCR